MEERWQGRTVQSRYNNERAKGDPVFGSVCAFAPPRRVTRTRRTSFDSR